MPIVILPADVATRLESRILALSHVTAVKMYAKGSTPPIIGFTPEELEECGAKSAEPIVLAVEDLDALAKAIPELEGGLRNYFPVTHPKVIAKLDPFADSASGSNYPASNPPDS